MEPHAAGRPLELAASETERAGHVELPTARNGAAPRVATNGSASLLGSECSGRVLKAIEKQLKSTVARQTLQAVVATVIQRERVLILVTWRAEI